MAWAVDDGVEPDAVSVWSVIDIDDDAPVALLPAWYSPAPARRRLLTGWPRRVAIVTAVAFIAIDAFGLCSTYGHIVFA